MPLPRFVDYSLRFLAPISLGLAIYYHYQSVQEREPTYYVNPSRARIVDTSVPAPPQLQVLYKGKDLNANVTAAVVYFWNGGKLPIKNEDILEPLKIVLEPDCKIIDARILKLSRPVTNFSKGEIGDSSNNVLPLDLRILERNDGAAIQVIYTGNPETHVGVGGTIVGAGKPKEATWLNPQGPPGPRNWRMKLLFLVLLTSAMSGVGTILLLKRQLDKDSRRLTRYEIGTMLGFVIAFILYLGIGYGYLKWEESPAVPQTLWIEPS